MRSRGMAGPPDLVGPAHREGLWYPCLTTMAIRRGFAGVTALVAVWAWVQISGCSASGESSEFGGAGTGNTGGSGLPDAAADSLMFGCNTCIGSILKECDDKGNLIGDKDCTPEVCVPGKGCMPCAPGTTTCVGNEVHACLDDGSAGDLIETCDTSAGEICGAGKCGTECDILAGSNSYVGCEFWAVDLPNERGPMGTKNTWAVFSPWGVVLVNAGTATAYVTIDINEAPFGQPVSTKTVETRTMAPGAIEKIVLPTREVTGMTMNTPADPGPPMTLLTSAAYRITSSSPLIVTQFNVFENSFSNDASLLLPKAALGTTYRVLGYPTANPVVIEGMPTMPGVPDHASVTVVGVEPGTQVQVKLSADSMGNPDQNLPAAKAGETVTATLGPFDTLNIASRSDCKMAEINKCLGDFTGTIVQASRPVVVFTSGERAILGPLNDNSGTDGCCTDHLEEQMFPVTSLGKSFLITHSPPRGSEPDVLRFMGVAETATVTTTLPPPDDSFTLQPGEMRSANAYNDIAVTSSAPIMVAQILISQAYTSDFIGDPSLTIFPPVEQYRKNYTFLVPGDTWTKNYFVIATETGNTFKFDGASLPSGCQTVTGPEIGGVKYEALRCPLADGSHTVEGDKPFGITVYGYGSAGSYAFVGGADIKPIYTPPPLL